MINFLKITTGSILLLAVVVFCYDEKKNCSNIDNQILQPINPNGDSELTLLMREMFDEAQQIKQQIAKEEPITLKINYDRILTAHATEPEKTASSKYQALANVYLQTMKNIQTASPHQLANIYDSMIENCMTCHKSICPGPMVKIKKLR